MVNHSGIQEGGVELEHPEGMTLMMPLAAKAVIGRTRSRDMRSSFTTKRYRGGIFVAFAPLVAKKKLAGIGRQHIKDGVLTIRQHKTGAVLAIPVVDQRNAKVFRQTRQRQMAVLISEAFKDALA